MTRSTQIQVRVSPEEKAKLEAEAKVHGQSLSEYLRIVGLNRTRVPNAAPVVERREPGPVERVWGNKDG